MRLPFVTAVLLINTNGWGFRKVPEILQCNFLCPQTPRLSRWKNFISQPAEFVANFSWNFLRPLFLEIEGRKSAKICCHFFAALFRPCWRKMLPEFCSRGFLALQFLRLLRNVLHRHVAISLTIYRGQLGLSAQSPIKQNLGRGSRALSAPQTPKKSEKNRKSTILHFSSFNIRFLTPVSTFFLTFWAPGAKRPQEPLSRLFCLISSRKSQMTPVNGPTISQ